MYRKIKKILIAALTIMLFTVCFSVGADAAKATVGTVSKLKATQTATSITLKWDEAKNATGYRIMEKKNGKWKTLVTTPSTSCTLTNLSAGSKHTYSVKAYRKNGNSKVWSKKSKTITAVTRPQKVKNLKATVNNKNVTLKWKKAKGATGYIIYHYDSANKKWVSFNKTTVLKTTIENLEPGKEYSFAVKAYCKKGKHTSLSASYTKTTVTISPENISSLEVTYSSSSSVTLSWKQIPEATGYRVYKYDDSSNDWKIVIRNTRNATATISDLKPESIYTFAVRAIVKSENKTVLSKKYIQISAATTAYKSSQPVSLIVNSYGAGDDGIIYLEVDPSNWNSNWVSATHSIDVKVNGVPLETTATCKIPSKKTGNSYEIRIDLSSQNINSGSVIDFTIPAGIIKSQDGSQHNLSYSASVTV